MQLRKMPSTSFLTILFSIHAILLVSTKTKAAIKLPKNLTVPALFAFGDSILDTGNNNHLRTLFNCDFPPYGRDFEGEIPTGRFSNGKVALDLIAEGLGIKSLVPAYLEPNLQTTDLLTGVNFASSASGYDPATSSITSVLSLSDQSELFKEYKEKLKLAVGEERLKIILRDSLYLVAAGSNDIAISYFLTKYREWQYDILSYIAFLVSQASNFLKDLHESGARRIGVFSTLAIGCLPAERALSRGKQRNCRKSINKAAELLNTKLNSEVAHPNSNLSEAKIFFVDIYKSLLDLIKHPEKHGFSIVDKGCCGTGNEAGILCKLRNFTCKSSDEYIFWDGIHPTERTYRILVSRMLKKSVHFFR